MFRRLAFFVIGLCVVIGMGFSNSITQAQTNVTWSAQYFNNTSLSGSPAATATLNDLNISWGHNAPATGIDADNWTARFNSIAPFNAGTYRFTVNADDAFRLYVHGQLLMDTFSNPMPNQVMTADITLAAGDGGIQVDFLENYGTAFLYVSWEQVSVAAATSTPSSTTSGAWSVQYFNNTNLSGTAAASTSVVSPNINWGNDAPASGVGVDNWTARLTSSIYFSAGTYRFSINVDDAIRLYVQNALVLDTFSNPQPDKPTTVDVTLPSGYIPIQIDYREYVGAAFLYVTWTQVSSTTSSTSSTSYGQAQLTVNTSILNFRSAPFIDNNIIAKLPKGASYPITGKTVTGNWYRIQVGQTVGWVFARLVIATNTANVPVINVQNGVVVPTLDAKLTINTGKLNVRSAPFVGDNIITQVAQGETYPIIGKNSSGDWYLIQVGQSTGWVSAHYVIAVNKSNVPVVNVEVIAPNALTAPTGYSLRAIAYINIRSGAGTGYSRLGILPYYATASIIARNSANTWWLISYKGVIGWVYGSYVTLPSNLNYAFVPVQ